MKNLIVLICAIGYACGSVSDQQANTIRSNFDHDSQGGYKYGFETDNGITAQADGKITFLNKDETAHQVQGSISYVSPEGQNIVITYVADENGYQPKSDSLPTPPAPIPIPDYIARALEYIAAHPYKEETDVYEEKKVAKVYEEKVQVYEEKKVPKITEVKRFGRN
ncbi:unnamed protein product [Parnassius apollo]|uniref:(apollo) hypothetical protein n=1 Tax=Parnassius apollo TaxID=110799 RepID=A0A8S3W4Q2_PARAO|nr:unnamed protein product [Parnassius apollo]